MVKLSTNDRASEWAKFMSDVSSEQEPLGLLTKQELRSAVDAIDDWIDNNTAAFNQAIPQPARGELTAQQKARLFMAIVRRRFEVT